MTAIPQYTRQPLPNPNMISTVAKCNWARIGSVKGPKSDPKSTESTDWSRSSAQVTVSGQEDPGTPSGWRTNHGGAWLGKQSWEHRAKPMGTHIYTHPRYFGLPFLNFIVYVLSNDVLRHWEYHKIFLLNHFYFQTLNLSFICTVRCTKLVECMKH